MGGEGDGEGEKEDEKREYETVAGKIKKTSFLEAHPPDARGIDATNSRRARLLVVIVYEAVSGSECNLHCLSLLA